MNCQEYKPPTGIYPIEPDMGIPKKECERRTAEGRCNPVSACRIFGWWSQMRAREMDVAFTCRDHERGISRELFEK